MKAYVLFLIIMVLGIGVVPIFAAGSPHGTSEGEPLFAENGHPGPSLPEHGNSQEKAEHKEPGMFDINWWILISQTINFFVLLFLLNKMLYGPINEIVKKRRETISRNLTQAEEANNQANSLKEKYETQLAKVEEESYQIRQNTIMEAQKSKQEILETAIRESDATKLAANQEIILDKQKAWIELRQEVVRLTLAAAEKVIDKALDEPTHHELIEKTIRELEKAA